MGLFAEKKRYDFNLNDMVCESSDLYRTTFEATGTAMVIIDAEGTILTVNQEMEKLTGYSREELVNRYKVGKFIHRDDRKKVLLYHRLRLAKNVFPPQQYSFRIIDRNGNVKIVMASVRVIPGTAKVVASLNNITEARLLEERLRKSEEQFRSLFENALEGIYQSTPSGKILLANPAFVRLLGYNSLEEVLSLNMYNDVYCSSVEREEIIKKYMQQEYFENVELKWRKKDGTPITVRASGRVLRNEAGEVYAFETMVVDITERKKAEIELEASKRLYENIINFLPDPTFAIDLEGKVIAWNMAMENLTGVKAKDILGKGDYEYALAFYGKRMPILIDLALNPDLPSDRYSSFRREGDVLYAEVYAPGLRNGKGAYVWGTASLLKDVDGNTIGAINTVKDFTEHKKTMEQLRYLSVHDALTGLYNRIYFDEEISRLSNERSLPVSVILCDVDGLKLLNDSMGHIHGDMLLKTAAGILRSAFRSSDMVARIGGDEFAVLLPNTDLKSAEEAKKRIKAIIRKYNAGNPQYPLSMSIGYATGGLPIQETLIAADNMLYKEKMKHGNAFKKVFIKALKKIQHSKTGSEKKTIPRILVLAEHMAGRFNLSEEETKYLKLLVEYHDIGIAGIDDRIINKPSVLSLSEMEQVKRHTEIGYRIAQSSPELSPISKYILHHHEWWDGSGYPQGLSRERIPLLSRMTAVLDGFEAMLNERPYRHALDCEEALARIKNEAGKKYDPAIVSELIDMLEDKALYREICCF